MKILSFVFMMGIGLLMSSFTTLAPESNISLLEDQLVSGCTATVTYNGDVIKSFTATGPNACTIAYGMACDYIEGQGGTCPQQ